MTGPNWLKKVAPQPTQRWWALLPVALGIATILWAVSRQKEIKQIAVDEEARPLSVAQAVRQDVRPQVSAFGLASPDQTWQAITEVAGIVIETHPRLQSGEVVRTGEMLLRIDPTDYELAVRQLNAERDSVVAQIDQVNRSRENSEALLPLEERSLEIAARERERLQSLFDRNAVSRSELDRAVREWLQQSRAVQSLRNTLNLLPADLERLTANLAGIETRLASAQRDLDRTQIKAPFTGRLVDVSIESGQYVARNQTLFRLHGVSPIEIEAQIPIEDLRTLLAGTSWDEFAARAAQLRAGSGFPPSNQALTVQQMTTPGQSPSTLIPLDKPDNGRNATLANSPSDGPPGNEPPIDDTPSMATGGSQGAQLALPKIDRTLIGVEARVRIEGAAQEMPAFEGRVVRLRERVDPLSRSVGVVVQVKLPRIDSPDTADGPQAEPQVTPFLEGTFCEVLLIGRARPDQLLIPSAAIRQGEVWVVNENNRLERRPIRSSLTIGNWTAVDGRLSPGERVVLSNPSPAYEGMLVEPVVRDEELEKLARELPAGDQADLPAKDNSTSEPTTDNANGEPTSADNRATAAAREPLQ